MTDQHKRDQTRFAGLIISDKVHMESLLWPDIPAQVEDVQIVPYDEKLTAAAVDPEMSTVACSVADKTHDGVAVERSWRADHTMIVHYFCPKCNSKIEGLGHYNAHLVRCRNVCAAWVKAKVDDGSPCNVCDQVLGTKEEFKKHIFLNHDDMDVKAKYQRDIQSLIGHYRMQRLRAPIIRKISKK